MRLYLRKNKKALENEKVPYFTLLVAPEQKDGDWLEVASFWKGKKLMEDGTVAGYNGMIGKGAVIDVSAVVPYKKQQQAQATTPAPAPAPAPTPEEKAANAAQAEETFNSLGD